MKTQLPPELVENMAIHVILARDYVRPTVDCVNECAQIAVDYADPYKQMLETIIKDHDKIEKQRDELVQASNDMLEGFKQLLIETGNPNKATDFTFVRRYLQLLKNHEDGK